MRVRYIVKDERYNARLGLSPDEQELFDRWNDPNNSPLTYGKEYTVLGLDYKDPKSPNVMIVDDYEFLYFSFYPMALFEVTDFRLSKYWANNKGLYYPIEKINYPEYVSFEEALDEYYFDDLIESRNDAHDIFLHYLKLMECEFPKEGLNMAKHLEEGWVYCAYCDELWLADEKNGVINCEYCNAENNNPLWSGIPSQLV